ncbi:MAG: hypothetical protein KGQ59_09240 [Bdellovibrionales bacterium]|nr:hypothetical protein [Bdellovibrionales bacterium]
MKVPTSLSTAFDENFQNLLAEVATADGLLPSAGEIQAKRFLSRSVAPHVQRLTELFNRIGSENPESGLEKYWKKGSNPENLRLAYFLSFMPGNLYRTAAVWSELHRLGFRWQTENFRAVEFGAGPATGSCGILAGESHSPCGLPKASNFALIEQDRKTLQLGEKFFDAYRKHLELPDFSTRTFHRKLSLKQGWLPSSAPTFHLWLMSYVLNEFHESTEELAISLLKGWRNHLEPEGIAILIEPALRLQSRRLLEIRQQILAHDQGKEFQILLPCLGHQSCGALSDPEDWCHEEVSWWRPPYLRLLDEMTGLDRKTLPFSYLVVARSSKPRESILPALEGAKTTHRLVSPAYQVGGDYEFYTCGTQDGKRRSRLKRTNDELSRGSILVNGSPRGDPKATRIDQCDRII